MPVSRRTGKRYAAGSHSTKEGYEDVTACCRCGEKLVISRQSVCFHTDCTVSPPAKTGWHIRCDSL